jgi:2-phospho-L-lactate/phosphoenolpyruvate guanylyltransferase
MAVWTIVPVKPLRRGKSRLSNVLDEDSREALNHCLLENTLDTLKSVKAIEEVLVISRDPRVLSIARSFHARTILESGAPELNHALERATLFTQRFAVKTVLIVPADIPLINTLDIEAILEAGKKPPVVVLVPDRHRRGTNAMLVSPPGLFKYRYGKNSFQNHTSLALEKGAHLEICDRPSLALDLDLPEDLDLVQKQMAVFSNYELEQITMPIPRIEVKPCAEIIRSLETGRTNKHAK